MVRVTGLEPAASWPPVKQLKTKIRERRGLLEEKKTMPALQVFQQRELAQKIATLLDAALMQYTELQQQAADMDAMELKVARHAIQPDVEHKTVQQLQDAYGKQFDSRLLAQVRKDITNLMNEEAELQSIRKYLRQKQRAQEGLNLPNVKRNEPER